MMAAPMDPLPSDAHIDEARTILGEFDPLVASRHPHNVAALATALAGRDRRGIGGNNPPEAIAPESLLRTDPSALPALLADSFGPLVQRSQDLTDSARAWQEDMGRKPLTAQEDADALADLMQQVMGFAHLKTGEVEAARQPVKRPIFDAGRYIDAFFNGLRNPLLEIAGQEPYPAGPTTMQGRLTAWVRAEAARKQAERLAEQRRLEDAARQAAEAARAPEAGDDELIQATVAEETAAQAARSAAAPVADMVRTTTPNSTTVGLRAKWEYSVVDFRAMVLAAAVPEVIARLASVDGLAPFMERIKAAITPAGGAIPLDWLLDNPKTIRAAITGERGRREAAGLEITNNAQASRRGV